MLGVRHGKKSEFGGVVHWYVCVVGVVGGARTGTTGRRTQQPAGRPTRTTAGAPTMTQHWPLTHGPDTKSPPVGYTVQSVLFSAR
jgi:hypothetical protein